MKLDRQSSTNWRIEGDWGDEFKARPFCSNSNIPVVVLATFVGSPERVKAYRAPHRLSRFVSSLPAAAVVSGISVTVDRSIQNIANWGSYLPSDCIKEMISLGWDRTTLDRHLEGIGETLAEIYAIAEESEITTVAAAERIGAERLAGASPSPS